MKLKIIFIMVLLSVFSGGYTQQNDMPELKGPYLGQKSPGMTPEIFAPGIVSTSEHEYGISFSKDLREIYLKRVNNGKGKNLVFCYENNKWNGPDEVKFDVDGKFGQLQMTSDGNHLLANHITTGQRKKGDRRQIITPLSEVLKNSHSFTIIGF